MNGQTGTSGGKGKAERRARGFARAGGLVAPQVRTAAAKRGFAEARLLTHWAEIAGPEIAAIARPVKMARGRGAKGATLSVLIEGAHAPQMQMMLPVLRARINAACGVDTVGTIRITQTSGAAGFADPEVGFVHDAPPPEPPAEQLAPVPTSLSSIGDPGLRSALETLAKNVLSRQVKSARTRAEK
jgi:hypothetical protein